MQKGNGHVSDLARSAVDYASGEPLFLWGGFCGWIDVEPVSDSVSSGGSGQWSCRNAGGLFLDDRRQNTDFPWKIPVMAL